MNQLKNNRTQWLHVRLTLEEYQLLHQNFSGTTCRKLSDYARRILLNKPLTVTYRNQSLDELMTQLVGLQRELSSLSNNFNQAVKKLHTLDQIAEYKAWLIGYETEKKVLLSRVDQIRNCIHQIADQWLAHP